MRKPLFLITISLSSWLQGQTDPGTSLASSISVDNTTTPATYSFSWWGKSDHHYIVETTPDLFTWSSLTNFNPSGADARLGIEYTNDAPCLFFRVIQFDPDDVSEAWDTDGDGLPDKWELYYFGHLGRDGSADFDGDGLSDRFEFQGGGNPITTPDATATERLNFTYDFLGRIDTLLTPQSQPGLAPLSMSFQFDNEGNLNSVQ